MSKETFGNWCPYKETLFCQEQAPCVDCQVYYYTMPLPYLGKTMEEVDRLEHWDALELERRSGK